MKEGKSLYKKVRNFKCNVQYLQFLKVMYMRIMLSLVKMPVEVISTSITNITCIKKTLYYWFVPTFLIVFFQFT